MGTGTGLAVAVIDVGSPPAAGGLGWCVASGTGLRRRESGRDLDRAVRAIAAHLTTGPVALGFEAPTFAPRTGTAPPRSSAGAGRGVPLGVSVATVVYTLRELKRLVPEARARLDWRRALAAPGDLLLFEALVAGPDVAGPDREAGALAAVRRAACVFGGGGAADAAVTAAETQLFSPVGVALVRARWRDDLAVLGEPCLVVRFRRRRPRVGAAQETRRISPPARDTGIGAQPVAMA